MSVTETSLPPIPYMPQIVGHLHHRPVKHFDRKVEEIIKTLRGIASFEIKIIWEDDESKHFYHLHKWEEKLGAALTLQATLNSDGAKLLRRDVRKFLPHHRAEYSDAVEGALYMVEELERFIRQIVFGSSVENDIIADFEPEPGGASVSFDW